MVRIRLSALLALIACVSVSVAQSQEDSVALLTGPRAVSELGAAVSVSDVDWLRRGVPVRALSGLLAGRVAGLVVLASSGTIGTASRLVIRGASSVRGSEAPQVYVDGIRVDDEPSTLTVSVGGQTTSRVDDVNVEDIATIAILRGPAAAALYGREATAGVLLVTTKREQGERPRLTAFTSQGLVTRAGRFPDNFLAVDSAGHQCDAGQLVTGACRLLRANVLESPATSPFRDGYLRQYGLRVSGGGPTTRYYLAGQWDGLAGVYALPGRELAAHEIPAAAGGGRPRPRESARRAAAAAGRRAGWKPAAVARHRRSTAEQPVHRRGHGRRDVSLVGDPHRPSDRRRRILQAQWKRDRQHGKYIFGLQPISVVPLADPRHDRGTLPRATARLA